MPGENVKPTSKDLPLAFPPGETIAEEIQVRGWAHPRFAEIIECPVGFVEELLRGECELTVDVANRLEAAFGVSAQTWLNMETRYRVTLAEKDSALLTRIRERAEAA